MYKLQGMKAKYLLFLLSAALAGVSAFSQVTPKERLDAFLRNEMKEGQLEMMSVAFEQHGEVKYVFAEGPRATEPTHVASVTKVVTSILLTQLVEEGRLCYNDYVQRYIPLFPTNNVTILHLMTHSSGWRNRGGHTKEPGKTEKFYGAMYKNFETGERFQYMSTGYNILAEIIERVTGVDDVADVAKSRVFDPLGMKDTNFAPHQGQAGMYTTSADLVKLGRELLDILKKRKTGILTPEGADALFHPVLRPEMNRTPAFFRKSGGTGFGQYFSDLNTFEAVSHSGATGANFLIDPGLDCVQVILTGTHDWGNNVFKSVDGNFSRINAMMISNFGEHVAPERPIVVDGAKKDQRRVLELDLQALYSRRAAGEKVDGKIKALEQKLGR